MTPTDTNAAASMTDGATTYGDLQPDSALVGSNGPGDEGLAELIAEIEAGDGDDADAGDLDTEFGPDEADAADSAMGDGQ